MRAPKQFLRPTNPKELKDFDSDLEDCDLANAMDNYDYLKPTEKLFVLKARANKLMDKFNKMGERMEKYEKLSKMGDEDLEYQSESSKGDISIDSNDYWIDGQGG